jgi:branched-chain amino acid transport system ATP-binding protein
MQASDRVVVMNEGRILTEGTPDEVRNDPRVIDAYLGTHG